MQRLQAEIDKTNACIFMRYLVVVGDVGEYPKEGSHYGIQLTKMSVKPRSDALDELPFAANSAFILCNNKLYYINKEYDLCYKIGRLNLDLALFFDRTFGSFDQIKTLSKKERKILAYLIENYINNSFKVPKIAYKNNEDTKHMLHRLLKQITNLITDAADKHRLHHGKNDSNELLSDKLNYVTTLLTNEFFFYTWRPLTLSEFQILIQKVVDLAKSLPQNLHLTLATFAVRTPNHAVMNTAVLIECGNTPIINLSVKNYESHIDPIYLEQQGRKVVTLRNVTCIYDYINDLKINIDGKDIRFSFNNVFVSYTAGGAAFYKVFDICLDHRHGDEKLSVALTNLENTINSILKNATYHNMIQLLPEQFVYWVLSNTMNLSSNINYYTHADPKHSFVECMQGVPQTLSEINEVDFGTLAVMFEPSLIICSNLEDKLLNQVNQIKDIYIKQKLLPVSSLSSTGMFKHPPRKPTNDKSNNGVTPPRYDEKYLSTIYSKK